MVACSFRLTGARNARPEHTAVDQHLFPGDDAMRMTTASTCCYCGVGCGVLIEHDGERIL
uniref:hypothetical protein n=1 Tax=Stutzerimonas kunmingensis TaxID=1211807 RepID=UPI0035E43973